MRGTFDFHITSAGDLEDCSTNGEALRALWLDRTLVNGEDLGPGDPGDFDHGAWHVSCHLVAAGGVRSSADGSLLWLEISHDKTIDSYYPSISVREKKGVITRGVSTVEGQAILKGSVLLGFVEGNSQGQISAKGVIDPAEAFNGNPRQDYDQPFDSSGEGGKVWEHWSTLRDIRPTTKVSASVLTAYITLTAVLGDLFPATVARGRREYGHPAQLQALVHAGFTAEQSAKRNIQPAVLPPGAERLLKEAQPTAAVEAAEGLDWSGELRYYMFSRKIHSWNPDFNFGR